VTIGDNTTSNAINIGPTIRNDLISSLLLLFIHAMNMLGFTVSMDMLNTNTRSLQTCDTTFVFINWIKICQKLTRIPTIPLLLEISPTSQGQTVR